MLATNKTMVQLTMLHKNSMLYSAQTIQAASLRRKRKAGWFWHRALPFKHSVHKCVELTQKSGGQKSYCNHLWHRPLSRCTSVECTVLMVLDQLFQTTGFCATPQASSLLGITEPLPASGDVMAIPECLGRLLPHLPLSSASRAPRSSSWVLAPCAREGAAVGALAMPIWTSRLCSSATCRGKQGRGWAATRSRRRTGQQEG
jgi:hypothetical protein